MPSLLSPLPGILKKLKQPKRRLKLLPKPRFDVFDLTKSHRIFLLKWMTKGSAFKILQVHLHQLDLSSQPSVRACAQGLINTLARIDVLINNAGVIINRITHGDHNDERGWSKDEGTDWRCWPGDGMSRKEDRWRLNLLSKHSMIIANERVHANDTFYHHHKITILISEYSMNIIK